MRRQWHNRHRGASADAGAAAEAAVLDGVLKGMGEREVADVDVARADGNDRVEAGKSCPVEHPTSRPSEQRHDALNVIRRKRRSR